MLLQLCLSRLYAYQRHVVRGSRGNNENAVIASVKKRGKRCFHTPTCIDVLQVINFELSSYFEYSNCWYCGLTYNDQTAGTICVLLRLSQI